MEVDEDRRVAGYCPLGCGQTLFLGASGHVTCSFVECPDPGLVDEILTEVLRVPLRSARAAEIRLRGAA